MTRRLAGERGNLSLSPSHVEVKQVQ